MIQESQEILKKAWMATSGLTTFLAMTPFILIGFQKAWQAGEW